MLLTCLSGRAFRVGNFEFEIIGLIEKYVSLSEYFEDPAETEVVVPATVEYEGNIFTVIAIGTIKTSLGSVKEPGFYYSGNYLNKITLPATIETLGFRPFDNRWGKYKIEVDPDNPYFCSQDGSLYSKDMKTIYYYYTEDRSSHLVIPDFIINIGNDVYSFNEQESLVIPSGIEEIGALAFTGWNKLKEIYALPLNPPKLDWGTFSYGGLPDERIPGIKVYVPAESIGLYKEATYWKDYKIYPLFKTIDDDGEESLTEVSVQ